METLWQDLRYGARMLTRNPGFTAVAVLTLALGIGANTAIFSVVRAALLGSGPLGYRDIGRLTIIFHENKQTELVRSFNSYREFQLWRARAQSLEEVAAYLQNQPLVLAGGDEPLRLRANFVSPSFFNVLGVDAYYGRTFLLEEDRIPNGHPVAVLTYELWQRRFGGDSSVVGRTITLSEHPYTVVGILPPAFHHFTAPLRGGYDIDVYLPLMMVPQVAGPSLLAEGSAHSFGTIARLRNDVTLEHVEAELETLYRGLTQGTPETAQGWKVRAGPLREVVVGVVRSPLLALLCVAGFVLLIGCANLANLLLVRATARQQEFAVRLALGASRGRLIGQLLTESILLALLGGAVGTLLALWGVDLLPAFSSVPLLGLLDIQIDSTVLLVALSLSLLVGVVFGLAPALGGTRLDLRQALHQAGRRGDSATGRGRLRDFLVVFEVAISLVLLSGAGLMIRSFRELHRTSPGFRTDHLLTLRLDLASSRYDEGQAILGFRRQAAERVRTLPGVESVALWGPFVPGESYAGTRIFPEGSTTRVAEVGVITRFHYVSPGALREVGLPILHGRGISAEDGENTFPVAVVSESLAGLLWPVDDPVGKRFRAFAGDNILMVVGIAGDARHRDRVGRYADNVHDIYLPHTQFPASPELSLVVRTSIDPAGLVSPIRQVIHQLDSGLPVFDIRTMEQLMAEEEADTQLTAVLMSLFAVEALLLATLGIYGVLAYSVSQRTHEIGIRMALGAQPRDIFRLVVGQGVLLTLIGVGVGLAASFALTRFLESMLFGVSATDPATFVGVAVLLATVAMLACYLPARRATKVDPLVALRYE